MNAAVSAEEKQAILAHYSAQAARATQTTAQRTKSMDWTLVTFGNGGELDARYTVDFDGIKVEAVNVGGTWVEPEDVFLPSLIECWEAEIAAALAEDNDHERTTLAHMGPL